MQALHMADLPIERTPAYTIVRFPDEVDIANADAIRDELLWLLNAGASALICDLGGTRFCDCSGLRVLVRAQLRANAVDVPLVAVIPDTGPVRRVMELTRLVHLIGTAAHLDEAKARITRHLIGG